MSTKYFNGTTGGNPYHATVMSRDIFDPPRFEIHVMIFDKQTGEPTDGFERTVIDPPDSPRAAVRAVIANRDNF